MLHTLGSPLPYNAMHRSSGLGRHLVLMIQSMKQQAAPADLSHLATDELDARVLNEQGIFIEFEGLVLTRTSQGYLSGVCRA